MPNATWRLSSWLNPKGVPIATIDTPISDESEQVCIRLEKLARLRTQTNPYPNHFKPSHRAGELRTLYEQCPEEQLQDKPGVLSLAGRVMAIRTFGKAAFLMLQDYSGQMQLYAQASALGSQFGILAELDLGDLIYVRGHLFWTKTKEFTLKLEELALTAKSLRPPPEKYHGIADREIRYRQRYLDLQVNAESRRVFQLRSQLIAEIRRFFSDRHYLEVETPMLHPIPGGAAARPFVTQHHALGMRLFLRIAPELYLKRLLVGGLERVFEINRTFRNEGISTRHNPEFTLLEFYEAYATYVDFMDLFEALFQQLAKVLLGHTSLVYQGTQINLGAPWRRLTVREGLQAHTSLGQAVDDIEICRTYAQKIGLKLDPELSRGEIWMEIFEAEVEPTLVQPTFVTHHPVEVSPLSRRCEADPSVVERFELFICGREMANCFSELNDPLDQKERFETQMNRKLAERAAAHPEQSWSDQLEARHAEMADEIDTDFLTALEYGMPPAAGAGIGIDRLVMLFTDSASIRDVILFPQLRSR